MLVDLTVKEFLNKVAGSDPVPGGGSIAALNGAIASALAAMVANLTIGKKGYELHEELMRHISGVALQQKGAFVEDIDRDSEAYDKVFACFKMPKATDEEKAARSTAIQEATKFAALVPMQVARNAYELMTVIMDVARLGNRNAVTDACVAMMSARSAVLGALMNVRIDLIERIINENLKLELAPEAKLRIQKCRDYLDKKIAESEEPLYGITTGFGSLCSKSISSDELGTLQENLIKSHACSVGEEIRPVIIKLMMLLKAHALSLGHSGVQVITVQRILDFFNNDVMPIVYDRGSLGASGDLAPLANLFLPLIGVGDVYYKGKKREAISVLDEFGWEPVKLMSKEGLALLNGTQFMSANGVFALLKAFRLSKKADLIAALSLEAFDGRIDPFMDCIQQIRPHKGQIETGANFRKLLEGSELIARPKQHVQDPYSFRCIPQVHGATKDAIRYVASVLLTEINSVTDNPTIFPDEDRIISGGNFHGQPLAISYDFLGIALAELGNISERRIAQLIMGLRGLPEFLVANPGLNSGFMIPQYAAASMVSQNKMYCYAASSDSIVSSNGQEDHVSMGANAATKLYRIMDNLEHILAIELMNAAQGIDFRRPAKTSPVLERFLHEYRKEVPFVKEDIVMYKEIHKTVAFLNRTKFDY